MNCTVTSKISHDAYIIFMYLILLKMVSFHCHQGIYLLGMKLLLAHPSVNYTDESSLSLKTRKQTGAPCTTFSFIDWQ